MQKISKNQNQNKDTEIKNQKVHPKKQHKADSWHFF